MLKIIHTDVAANKQQEFMYYPGRSLKLLEGCVFEIRFSNEDDNSEDGYELFETKMLKQFDNAYIAVEGLVYKSRYDYVFNKVAVLEKFKKAIELFATYVANFRKFIEFKAPFFETVFKIYSSGKYPILTMTCMYRYTDEKTNITKFLEIYSWMGEQFSTIKREQKEFLMTSVQEKKIEEDYNLPKKLIFFI